jgi:predicted transcriptional regulator
MGSNRKIYFKNSINRGTPENFDVDTRGGVVLEKPCKLMFELSSSERMNLLLKLQKQKMKLSHISEKLDMTITETSRHLQRLTEAKLIQKDLEGLYGLTHFGNLTLSLLSGICFISKNSQYFVEHDLSHLPPEFVERIGELSSIPPGISDIMTSFRLSEIMLQDASEYIWIMSDQILTTTLPIIGEKMKSGVEFRFIFPENIVPPPGVKREVGAQRRKLSKVEEIILMTEKEVMFGFPDLNGKMDYALLTAKEATSHKWCKDLFLNRWDKAISAPVPLQTPSTTKQSA